MVFRRWKSPIAVVPARLARDGKFGCSSASSTASLITIKEEPSYSHEGDADGDDEGSSESSHFVNSQAVESDRSDATSVHSSIESVGAYDSISTEISVNTSLNSLADPAWLPDLHDLDAVAEAAQTPRVKTNPMPGLKFRAPVKKRDRSSGMKVIKCSKVSSTSLSSPRFIPVTSLVKTPPSSRSIASPSSGTKLPAVNRSLSDLVVASTHCSSSSSRSNNVSTYVSDICEGFVVEPSRSALPPRARITLSPSEIPRAIPVVPTVQAVESSTGVSGAIPVPPSTRDPSVGLDEAIKSGLFEEVRSAIEDIGNWPDGLLIVRSEVNDAEFRLALSRAVIHDWSRLVRTLMFSVGGATSEMARHKIYQDINCLNYKIWVLTTNFSNFVLPGFSCADPVRD